MDNKKLLGQFFTVANPFYLPIFYKWFELIPSDKKQILLEPFAGSNNIVNLVNSLELDEIDKWNWSCYDIDTTHINNAPDVKIIERDTLKDFPTGYSIAITNPPYLAKNSAKRSGYEYPNTEYDDLYKYSLSVMLNNLEYVAAIVPETFIKSNEFRSRLYAISSLTCKMFSDTDCPVCLALFIPEEKKFEIDLDISDFIVYKMSVELGKYSSIFDNLNVILDKSYKLVDWRFNDKLGTIGINCIDNTKEASICFIDGNDINKDKIKSSSRSLTLVSGLPSNINLEKFLFECNKVLKNYRELTYDIFMASFKGLRSDMSYRRRLDFKTARDIMDVALCNVIGTIQVG